jgi:hypothetical protein
VVIGLLGHAIMAFALNKYSHVISGLGDDGVMEDASK